MYQNRNFQNSGFPYRNAPQGRNYQPQPAPQFKNSGVVYSKIGKGEYVGATIVNAWNKSKRKGLITCTVAPYKNTKKYTSERGNEYQTMIAVVKYHNSGVEKIIPCSMNTTTKVIALSEIGMVISPNGSGTTRTGKRVKGYFGTFVR